MLPFIGLISIIVILVSLGFVIYKAIKGVNSNVSMKKTLITFGTSILVFIIAVLATPNNSTTTTVSAPLKQIAVAQAPVVPKVKTSYKIGESAVFNNVSVTVISMTKSMGAQFDTPKNGNEYIIVKVAIKNTGTSDADYNPYDFKMENSKGQITDNAITTVAQNTALQSGSLAQNGTVSGTMVFEQPINDPTLTLKYTGNIFNNSGVNFKLN